MASLLPSRSSTTGIPISFNSPFYPKKPQISVSRKQPKILKNVPCKATRDDDQMPSSHPNNNSENDDIGQSYNLNHVDRRNVLIGIGGLYGAASLSNDPLSLACPFLDRPQSPYFNNCSHVSEPTGEMNCCPPPPPKGTKIIDFQPPKFSKIRVRPAAHLVDEAYKAKFAEGIQRMKELPGEHPHNFMQQANIHCAYCDGAYRQSGSLKYFEVHNSWLFFPFHRLYLYFFERILGKLIGDPDFGIPFWNWDHPDGMVIPDMYLHSGSPLYDDLRNQNHVPPSLIDLTYTGTDDIPRPNQKLANLKTMYGRMISNSTTPSLFFGRSFSIPGQIELIPHNKVHNWCGRKPDEKHHNFGEDMGIFYSAGRDPIFYAHHANIDRLWTIWNTTLKKYHEESVIKKDAWLDSSFIFYDENENLVRVKVRDSLDNQEKLGYTYQQVDIPWEKTPPTTRMLAKTRAERSAVAESNKFPLDLDKEVSIEIRRPPGSSKKEEEVLVIEKIEFEKDKFVEFDVFINDEGYKGIDGSDRGPEYTQYAGSFVQLPRSHKQGKNMKTDLWLGISNLLKNLEAEDDESITVSLVPSPRSGKVKIGDVKITFTRD